MMHCSSLTRSLAMGYRIGWNIPNNHETKTLPIALRLETVYTNPSAFSLLFSELLRFVEKNK
jgi:hypothetical protein